MELDRFGGYVLAAFGITWGALGAYLLLLRARLNGARRQLERLSPPES